MSVPTQAELHKRQQEAHARVEQLRRTYEDFLKQWEDVEKEEYALLTKLHHHIDETDLHRVLKKITHISDS